MALEHDRQRISSVGAKVYPKQLQLLTPETLKLARTNNIDFTMSDRRRLASSSLKSSSPLFWFTLVISVAIIGIGVNFILNPVGASTGYGIPIHNPTVFPFMWIKGIRDIFSGLIVLWSFWKGDRQIIATLFAIATLIPISDGFIILGHLGFAPPIYIHWGTAIYMIVVTRLLFQRTQ